MAEAYQQGKGFEGVSYEDSRGAMTGRGKLPPGLRFENMLAEQGPRLETLLALEREIELRLTAVAVIALKAFGDRQQGGVVPIPVLQPAEGSYDPSGNSTLGRYTVVFRGNWSQSTGGTPPRKIIANTATTITWDIPMVINPGDVWIIEEATWPYSYDTTSFSNADPLASATINMPTNNFVDTNLLISGFTIDVNGNESPDGDAPIREDTRAMT